MFTTYSIPQPVGGSRETDTTSSDWEREDLADNNPGTWTPGGCEEEDEDSDEGDLRVDSRDVVGDRVTSSIEMGVVEADSDTNDGDEELADQHAQSTIKEDCSATELLDGVEGDRSRADIDQGEDQGNQEGVGDGTSRLEERSRVVEDEVDTSPLLHHLKRCTQDGSSQVRLLVCESTREAVHPAAKPGGDRDELSLVFFVGNDLCYLSLDVLRLCWLASKTAEGSSSGFNVTSLDEVSWGIRQEEQSNSQNDCPSKLDADRDSVRASIGVVLGAVNDAGREQDTNGDAELVSSNQSTSNLLRANFAHVQDDDGRFETNTETSNKTADDDDSQVTTSAARNTSDHLDNNTDCVDEAAHDDSPFSTNDFSDVATNDSTEESTS